MASPQQRARVSVWLSHLYHKNLSSLKCPHLLTHTDLIINSHPTRQEVLRRQTLLHSSLGLLHPVRETRDTASAQGHSLHR